MEDSRRRQAKHDRVTDAAALRRMARKLEDLAQRLERPADLPTNRAPCTDEEAARIAATLSRVREVLNDEPHGTDESNRGKLVALCTGVGSLLRNGEPTDARIDASLARIVATYAESVPEQRTLVRSSAVQERIRAVVVAQLANKGGRPRRDRAPSGGAKAVKAAVEELCDLMGYPANRETIQRTELRRRAKRAVKKP